VINIILFIALILMGIYDLYLVYKKQPTISQRIQGLFPKAVDKVIMILTMSAVWYFGSWILFTHVMWGIVIGHFLWNE